MPLSNYSELRTAVAGAAPQSWSHRTDVLGVFDTFLHLAEEEMYAGGDTTGGIRIRDMLTTDTTTLSTSVRTLALPTNFLEFRKLNLEYSDAIYPPLQYRTPHELRVYSSAGHPCYYTVTSQIEFDRVADVAYTLNRVYYAKLTGLSSSNTTNSILTRFPSIYLYGCMSQLYKWNQNIEKAVAFHELFMDAIEKANAQEKKGNIGPTPQMVYQGSIA